MPSAGDLVTECVTLMHGGTSSQDRVTALAADVAATDLTFTVTATFGQAVGISPGIVEIDSELLFISGADASSNICTIVPFGRGFQGSTQQAHKAGSQVTSSPTFPRWTILRAMNETIGGLYPDLFGVETITLISTDTVNTYPLDSEAAWIISAWYPSPLNGDRIPLRRFMKDPFDNALLVGDPVPAGSVITVTYAVEPQPFTGESDDFENVTGLPVSCSDLLVYGATIRLTPGLDISRAQTASVEQSARSTVVSPNAGMTASKYIMALYQDRLLNEKRSLRKLYPPRIVRSF